MLHRGPDSGSNALRYVLDFGAAMGVTGGAWCAREGVEGKGEQVSATYFTLTDRREL
jgi:hypothetical protein